MCKSNSTGDSQGAVGEEDGVIFATYEHEKTEPL